MVFIRMKIQNLDTDEEKVIEVEAGGEARALTKFLFKGRKFANPKWKILSIETDSLIIYSYIQKYKPNLPIELVEKKD